MRKVYWVGSPPPNDDFGNPIGLAFIDGKTRRGPWAIMTPTSHRMLGIGLGPGKGQRYEKQEDGRWMLVEKGEG